MQRFGMNSIPFFYSICQRIFLGGFIKTCMIRVQELSHKIKMQATHTHKNKQNLWRYQQCCHGGSRISEDDTHWVIVSSMHRCMTQVQQDCLPLYCTSSKTTKKNTIPNFSFNFSQQSYKILLTSVFSQHFSLTKYSFFLNLSTQVGGVSS